MQSSEWREVALAEVVDVKHGFAFSGENIREEPLGDILLTPGNFAIGGGFKATKFKYFDGFIPDDYVLDEGDLLVTMTDLSKQADTLGYPAFVPKSAGLRYLHNQRLGKVLIREDVDLNKRFLFYLLCTANYRNEVLASATGTTVKHTSPSRILAHIVRLPSLPEQKAIADILGSLDDKIELNRRTNETLEAMARAIFKSWFIDFDPVHAKSNGRLPDGMVAETAKLFPNSFEDTEIGKVPKGWKVGTLGETYNLTMGQSPAGSTYNEDGDGLPFYQGRRDFGFRYPVPRIHCNAPTRIAQQGDTLVSVRAPVGDINMSSAKCCIGRGIASVRHQSGSRSFTYYSIQGLQPSLQQFEGNGTVFGSINKDQFERLVVVAPSDDAVRAYENAVSSMDDKIEILTKELDALSATRDALLPRLLSGEITIEIVERMRRGQDNAK